MFSVETLGYVAGVLTTFGFIPQLIRIFRLKSAHEISLPFTVLMLAGITFWLIYGIYLGSAPMTFWNSISLALLSILFYAKLKYGR